MLDNYAPPGRPHIIRWHTPHEATIATVDGETVARLSVPPGDEPEFAIVREPGTPYDRELLFRALVWATEEHARAASLPGN